MAEILFQDKLKTDIDNIISKQKDFPRTSIIVGEEGSGRKETVKYIAEKLDLGVLDITEQISLENITQIYSETEKFAYIIDVDKLTEKSQNVLLKFIEEPPITAYIFLICENETTVLPTVCNRCIVFRMRVYTIPELKQIISKYGKEIDEEMFNIIKTPGKLLKLSEITNIDAYIGLSDKIVKNIHKASYVNSLKLTSYFIAKKDEKEPQLDINLFSEFMMYSALCCMKDGAEFCEFMRILKNFRKDLKNKSYNKKFLLDKLFFDLRSSFV